MASKLILTRQRSANAVVESVKTNSSLIGAALDTLFTPLVSAGAVPKGKAQLELYGALLARDAADMVAKDAADIKEGLDDAEPIARRDTLIQAIYDKLVGLRRTLNGVYGEATTKALGFRGEISRDPQTMSRFVSEMVKIAPDVKLPAPLIEGVSVDLSASLHTIGDLGLKLEAALSDVAREVREGQQTLSEKNAAIARYDQTFSAVVPILENLYRLAGKPDLADKIRPSTRRPGEIEEIPEETKTTPTSTHEDSGV